MPVHFSYRSAAHWRTTNVYRCWRHNLWPFRSFAVRACAGGGDGGGNCPCPPLLPTKWKNDKWRHIYFDCRWKLFMNCAHDMISEAERAPESQWNTPRTENANREICKNIRNSLLPLLSLFYANLRVWNFGLSISSFLVLVSVNSATRWEEALSF